MAFHHNTKTIAKKVNKWILPLALAGVFIVSPVAQQEVLATRSSEIQRQQAQTQSQLNAAQNAAANAQAQQAAVSSSIDATNSSIVQNMTSISLLEGEIARLDTQISEKQQEYDKAKAEETKQYTAMKARLKYMYEKGDTGYLEILLKASSFSDMLNKTEYVNQLYAYDRNMVAKYQRIQEEVAQVQSDLEDAKSEQEESKHGLEEEQYALQVHLNELKQQYSDYETQIANARAQASKLTAQLQQQQNALRAAQAEEEAAAKRAAEEAARKASQSNSSSSSSSSSTKKTNSSAYNYTPQQYTGTLTSNANGVTGQDVVNYAVQFVGNPYVYGGTSLTNGADCSGFTMSVYKHFGYSLGRTDVAQRSNGIAVSSLAEALPGDIICYPGHVALYIGNGMVVHASTARTGIKYSNANYRAYVAIRRIIY